MSLGQQLAPHLPFLRRYGRALTGSQAQGDRYVRATLEAIVAAPDQFPRDVDPRLGLYRTFQAIWNSANYDEGPDPEPAEDQEAVARARLSRMTPLSMSCARRVAPTAGPTLGSKRRPGMRRTGKSYRSATGRS